MAEEHQTTNVETEIKDRGMFDFLGKKEEEKPVQEDVIATDLQKVHISEPEEKKEDVVVPVEEKKPSLLEKLHRSNSSSSSSSSEEEVEEGGEKIRRKKKKGVKETLKEKISGEKEEEKKGEEDTSVPIEKFDDEVGVVTHAGEVPHPEEKKTFMAKIKEKLPGSHKKPAEECSPVAPIAAEPVEYAPTEAEPKEKKGILEKIKEKLPGYHKTEDDKKETTDH